MERSKYLHLLLLLQHVGDYHGNYIKVHTHESWRCQPLLKKQFSFENLIAPQQMWTYWGKGVVGSELVSSFCSWWGLITCLHNGPELEGDVITTELSPCLIPWNIWRPAEVKPYVESPQWAPWWIFKPVHRSARMWEGLDEPLVFKHLRDSQAWFI